MSLFLLEFCQSINSAWIISYCNHPYFMLGLLDWFHIHCVNDFHFGCRSCFRCQRTAVILNGYYWRSGTAGCFGHYGTSSRNWWYSWSHLVIDSLLDQNWTWPCLILCLLRDSVLHFQFKGYTSHHYLPSLISSPTFTPAQPQSYPSSFSEFLFWWSF